MTNDDTTPGRPPAQAADFGSHDDPIVVDNGPTRIDFGDGHAPKKQSEKVVTREYTTFSRLITTVIDITSKKVKGRAKTHRLAPTVPLTFTITDGTITDELVFSVAHDTLTVTSDTFPFRLDGREWKPADGKEPRITRICQGKAELLKEDSGDLKERVILATVLATPESKEGDAVRPASRSGERGASPVRVTALLSVVALLALFGYRIFEGSRGSHDDPVVVDNGPIAIVKGNAVPVRKDSDKRWTIHHSDRLRLLYAFTQARDGETWRSLEQPISLSGVKNITFDLVEPGLPKSTDATIFRGRWYEELVPKVHLDAKIDFTRQGSALSPADQKYRIGQVWVDDVPICLVDTDRPVTAKCSDWRQKPYRVKILLCTNPNKCESYFPPTR